MLNWLGLPVEASAHAAEIDQMIVLVHWLMLLLFVGWGAFFVFVLVRFRKGANPTASYAGAKGKCRQGTRGRRRRRRNRAARRSSPSRRGPSASNALPERERGDHRPRRRRAVCLEHPLSGPPTASSAAPIPKLVAADNPLGLDRTDPNAKDDITTINQLNLPVESAGARAPVEQGRHSQLRPLRDAREAGRHSRAWTSRSGSSRTVPANYEITCSQLCGLGHYRMRGFVTIQTQADFDAWMAEQVKQLTAAARRQAHGFSTTLHGRPVRRPCLMIRTIDAHAAGGPLRLVVDGFPSPRGRTMLEKRALADASRGPSARARCMLEPRGHADMCGAAPDRDRRRQARTPACCSWTRGGYSTMSGHGIIAVTTIALERGLIVPGGDGRGRDLDTPARDRPGARDGPAAPDRGVVERRRVLLERAVVRAARRRWRSPRAAQGPRGRRLRRRLLRDRRQRVRRPADRRRTSAGTAARRHGRSRGRSRRRGRSRIRSSPASRHRRHDLHRAARATSARRCATSTIFADGRADRSAVRHRHGGGDGGHRCDGPARRTTCRSCTKASSARAVIGRVAARTMVGDYPAIVPEIEGAAWITGEHTFVIDDDDPLKDGISSCERPSVGGRRETCAPGGSSSAAAVRRRARSVESADQRELVASRHRRYPDLPRRRIRRDDELRLGRLLEHRFSTPFCSSISKSCCVGERQQHAPARASSASSLLNRNSCSESGHASRLLGDGEFVGRGKVAAARARRHARLLHAHRQLVDLAVELRSA